MKSILSIAFVVMSFAIAQATPAPTCQNYVGEGGFFPVEDSLCECAATQNCIGKCCPSTGKCRAASCNGNKINTGGKEHECVVYKDGTNKGGQCPWANQPWGVYCNYVAGCENGKKNNCYGYTACGTGSCPASSLGVFCIESGNSDNFKICDCDAANVEECKGQIITKCDFYVTSFNKPLVVSASNGVVNNDVGATSAELVSSPSSGVLVFNQDGSFTYTPNKDFCGTDKFTYKAIKDDCYETEEVVITTTCGCGEQTDIVQCKLDNTNPTTNCVLPGGKVLTVASVPGYSRARIRINAKVTYKV
jgi:hypothetical protein